MGASSEPRHPILDLAQADLEFVYRFVLASGSLKDLARTYGVSYPTIRSRLDRLIERVQEAARGRPPDPMGDLLGRLAEQGEVSLGAAQAIRELHSRLLDRTNLDGKERPS